MKPWCWAKMNLRRRCTRVSHIKHLLIREPAQASADIRQPCAPRSDGAAAVCYRSFACGTHCRRGVHRHEPSECGQINFCYVSFFDGDCLACLDWGVTIHSVCAAGDRLVVGFGKRRRRTRRILRTVPLQACAWALAANRMLACDRLFC